MNARQLQYAILLSQQLSFSQVAEQLNISQPALSKQILSLEQELGVKLFDRSSSPLSLTPAGAFFVEEAKLLLHRQTQLLHSMERFRSGEEGRLVIGITPFRSLYLIPDVVRQVQQKYPGIQIVLHESGSDRLRKEAIEGKFDFAVVNLPVDESVLDVTPLEPDVLVLAVPAAMAASLPACTSGDPCPELDFSLCRDLPFVVVGQSQDMRQLFDRLCARACIHPHIAAEVVGITTAWAMANAGIGAALLPLQFVRSRFFDKNLVLYRVKDTEYVRRPAVIVRHGQHLPEYARYAIELLTAAR